MSGAESNRLVLTRDFAATPAAVWALFTEPRLLARWFAASHGFRVRDAAIDLQVGGRWSVVSRRGPETDRAGGVYHVVDPERRLTYSYHFDGTTFFSVVTIALSAVEGGTRLDLLQTGFPDHQAWVEHGRGWPIALRIMGDALLLAVGADRLATPRRPSGVEADLEAARARLEEEGRMVRPAIDPPEPLEH